jgi:hypoxanthine phosphoribosyltransferase
MPAMLRGIKVYPDSPFRFDFILDKGNFLDSGDSLKEESSKLIKYFMASLTVPEKDLWVNLSPYEKDRIVPDAFGQTGMGRDLLIQDYLLKQITASIVYPEGETGRKFWAEIYKKAQEQYGTTDIPIDTFNKVWIVPAKTVVYENAKTQTAYVVESRLKVMLESDYVALDNAVIEKQSNEDAVASGATQEMIKDVIRQVVLPELEKEVNEGKNFAPLRQIYQSFILSAWFKKKIRESILSRVYVDRNKVVGVNIQDVKEAEKIWMQYVESFKKGAYNYIKEEQDVLSGEVVPYKFFSGGCHLTADGVESAIVVDPALLARKDLSLLEVGVDPAIIVEPVTQAVALPQTYQDKQGRIRVSIGSITDPPLRLFFDQLIKNGLKRNVQIYGESVRDILAQGRTPRMTFFLSPVTEPQTVKMLFQSMQEIHDLTLVNMGHIDTYDFRIPDIAVGKMMLTFDMLSDDPVLVDPQDGLRDLKTRQARLVGRQDDFGLSISFPKIVRQMVSLGLGIHPRDKVRLGRVVAQIRRSFKNLGGDALTSSDRELLAAIAVYRDWNMLLTTGDLGIMDAVWKELIAWQKIRSEMGGQLPISELIGVATREDFQAKAEEAVRSYAARPSDDQYVSSGNTSFENAPGGIKEGAVPMSKLEDGEWAISEQLGLIRVKRAGGVLRYAPIPLSSLINVLKEIDIEAELLDADWTGGSESEIFRWVATRGRVDYIPEGAYVTAQKRAEAYFSRDYLSLKAAFEVLRARIQMKNSVAKVYRSALDGVIVGDGSAADKMAMLQALFVRYESGEGRGEDVLKPVRRFVLEACSNTGDDLVKTGVLQYLSQEAGDQVAGKTSFMFTDKTVSADVGFYWITELMESGISGVDMGSDGFLVTLSGKPFAELLPYSHPFFPYSDFSKKYFEAKVAGPVQIEMADYFSEELAKVIHDNQIQADVIIGVPTVPGAANQLDPLLDSLSAKTGIPVNRSAIGKTAQRNKQKLVKGLLGKSLNVVGAYHVQVLDEIKGKIILLVDDHWGTGLTLQEIRRQLLDAGAGEVIMMPLTGSPEKKDTALEVRITKTNENLNDSIHFLQAILTPDVVSALAQERIQFLFSDEAKRPMEVSATSMARQITDSLFANNVIELWSGELAKGFISKIDLEARIRRLVVLMADSILHAVKLGIDTGRVTENKVVLTNPQKSLETITSSALDDVDMILSDMDETLAGNLTPLKPEMAGAIVQALVKGKKFALVSQQNVQEIRAYFLAPILEYMERIGISTDILHNIFFFEACGNGVYQYDPEVHELVRLSDLPPLLSSEQARLIEQVLKEVDSIRTLHVSNRADAIFTAYYETPIEANIALQVLEYFFKSSGLPVDVISNGATRVRVIASGLSKKRARDYMAVRFPQISSPKKMVLGDNFDPENSLSDIGLISGREGDVQALPGVIVHRDLIGALKAGKETLSEILEKRGHLLTDGLMPFEAESLLDQFAGNIYDSSNGKILTKSLARIQMNSNSLVYFLDDSVAILVNDHRAVIDPMMVQNPREEPIVLSGQEKLLLDWVRGETGGDTSRVAVLTLDVVRMAGFGTLGEAQAVMNKKLKMKTVDGTPYAYIGFWELPGRFIDLTKNGGIDFTPSRVSLQTFSSGGDIKFNIDPAMVQELESAPGFEPVIMNIRPMTDLKLFFGLKEQEALPVVG